MDLSNRLYRPASKNPHFAERESIHFGVNKKRKTIEIKNILKNFCYLFHHLPSPSVCRPPLRLPSSVKLRVTKPVALEYISPSFGK